MKQLMINELITATEQSAIDCSFYVNSFIESANDEMSLADGYYGLGDMLAEYDIYLKTDGQLRIENESI